MTKVYDNATDLITFARGSSATYTGSDGTQQTAASDEPRIEYAADGTLKGLLIEEQRTNLLLNSDNPDTQVASLAAGSHTLSFVGGPSVTGIDDTITANAVDVFVYDTSKDSDGGAWRTGSLAQASSWYNETLNTSTRGSRKEFPAVAVIVAEANKVTIYDGDDPSLPMWMVFSEVTGTAQQIWRTGRSATCVAAKNGTLVIGLNSGFNDSFTGLVYGSFLEDKLRRVQSFELLGFDTFAERNLGNQLTIEDPAFKLVDSRVNDVAMTVLPDAPTDPATGLPVPTIAVATQGGVSVIKDDGTVVSKAYAAGTSLEVSLSGTAAFITGIGPDSYYNQWTWDFIADVVQGHNGRTTTQLPTVIGNAAGTLVEAADDTLSFWGWNNASGRLVSLLRNTTAPTKGMVAYTTSSYATGWMPGDTKLAALADTTAETLSGTPLLDEDGTSTTGWSGGQYNAAVSSVSGVLRVTGGTSNYASAAKAFTTVVGQTYIASVDLVSQTNRGWAIISTSQSSYDANRQDIMEQVTALGTYTLTFTADATTSYLHLLSGATTSATAEYDNISVRLADPDRSAYFSPSVNGNGLGVHGSITKTAVATGADVVAYSGFSASNYLEQPYNKDLDFGTGDFSIMGWVKATAAPRYVIDRADIGYSGSRISLYRSSAGNIRATVTGSAEINSGADLNDTWQFVVLRRASGVLYLSVNDSDPATASNTSDLSNTSAILRVGLSTGGSFANQNLALLRISATAPTADQIAKIYEDERPLFQPNAKATLTGSSDAVTALAYDPDTDLLHVGTSGGRSVFQGLRRVDETATAVTTAISAVDGLIVEQ